MENNIIVAIAAKEIGYIEDVGNHTKYGKWFGLDGVAWCGIFVSWCYAKALKPLPNIGYTKGFAGCQTAANWFKLKGKITKTPSAGDIVLFDWAGSGKYVHTGIYVRDIDGVRFETIEGNTSLANQSNGGSVMRRTRLYKNAIFAHI